MTHVEIPRFGYKPGDFKATPFSFELSRIGVQSAGPRSFAHRHSYYHVLWLTRGDGVHVIDFEEFALKPPSVFFIAPHQVHFWSSGAPADGYIFKFSIDFFQRLMTSSKAFLELPFASTSGDPVIYIGEAEQDRFEPALQQLLEEYSAAQAWRADMITSLLQSILLRLLRVQSAGQSSEEISCDGRIARGFGRLLDSHLLSTTQVDDYARMLSLSPSALNEAMKRSRGRTALQLISERLLLEAKRRLLFSSAPVGEVGVELGFNDPAYFARFFRKGAGMSPLEFRRSHQH